MRVRKTGRRSATISFSSTPRDQAAAVNMMNTMMRRAEEPVCKKCGGLLHTDRKSAACACGGEVKQKLPNEQGDTTNG